MQERIQKLRMVRKQVYITADQDRRLKARAKANGQPAAEVLRAMLDTSLNASEPVEDKDAWKKVIVNLKPIWQDREDMHEIVRDMRKGWGRRAKRLGLDPNKP